MALTQLTKVDGGGISTTSDYRVGIITGSKFVGPFDGTAGNFSGVVTATNGVFSGNISAVDGTFSGNVSIAGTLTYEDVTNIDSVGIITAREGIHIPDYKKLDFGGTAGSGDFEIRHTNGHSHIQNNTGHFFITQGTAASSHPLIIHGGTELQLKHYYSNGGALFALKSVRGYQTEIYWQGQKKIETSSTGITVTGSVVATGADINGDLDVDGHTNLDNVSVAGVSTFSDRVIISGGKDLFMFDNGVIRLGNDSNTADFQMFHDGGHTRLNNATGSLYINNSSTNGSIRLNPKDGESGLIARYDGPVELFYDNTLRFSTSGVGATVYGNLDVTADIDVDGHTNLDNVSIAGITTFSNATTIVNGGYHRGIINSGAQAKIIGGYISGSDTL